MRRILLFCLILIPVFLAALPCAAADIDPILIDKPNPRVYECTEDLVIELLVDPIIEYSAGGKIAKDCFLFMTVEFLYLQERNWNGLDKNSFFLLHTDPSGMEEIIPLNYMMTSMMTMKNGWKTMSDQLEFGSLEKMILVFDVDTTNTTGWTLIFRPAERGGNPACEIEIPLRYFRGLY